MASLFKLHNPLINSFMQESSDNCAKGVRMSIKSIRKPWRFVARQIEEFNKFGLRARCIRGSKEKSMLWLEINKDSLYRNVMASLEYKGRRKKVEMMLAFLEVPNLGLAKAGFCCQLFGGVVGCIDTHNVRHYNVDLNVLSYDKNASLETRLKKINAYLDLCQRIRSEHLWNRWCNDLARKDKRFKDAFEVSELHFTNLQI